MTDEQKAQRLLDRASRRLTPLEKDLLTSIVRGSKDREVSIDSDREGTKLTVCSFRFICERFAQDLI